MSTFSSSQENPDIFPGFFHINLENNVQPKFELLRKFSFYPDRQPEPQNAESCGGRLHASQ